MKSKNATIHWKINGVTGHGAPQTEKDAREWVRILNERFEEKFGPGTHWVVIEEEEEEFEYLN